MNVIPETQRIAPRVARLRDELEAAKSALGAAQFERNAITGDDPHTISVLDLRIDQAREAVASAVDALTAAESNLAEAREHEKKRNPNAN